MGQMWSTSFEPASVSETMEVVRVSPDWNALTTFNEKSKTGTGVHMFKFQKDDQVIYIGSEVTDVNNVLDVVYKEWIKSFEAITPERPFQQKKEQTFVRPKNNLREVWKPNYTFSSGRVAMVAVLFLLKDGYTMTEIKPE